MAHKKAAPPAIRRINFKVNLSEDLKLSYREQLAAAEQKAGRKVTRVHTRHVRLLTAGGAYSPSKFIRPTTHGHALVRTFIFR